jgi:hypothetical protein
VNKASIQQRVSIVCSKMEAFKFASLPNLRSICRDCLLGQAKVSVQYATT